MKSIYLYCICILLYSCASSENSGLSTQNDISHPELPDRPNILWIVAEDLGPYIPSFGDSTIETPHLSWLASEGVCYDHFYTPSPVCAPARSAIATGMYPTAIGTNHMRTGPWYAAQLPPAYQAVIDQQIADGAKFYEAIPPKEVKMFSEYLRKAGYYCTNNAKEDYQFKRPVTAWDECGRTAHWQNAPVGQPFFSMMTLEVTHESRIWQKAEDSLWVDTNLEVPVPPYLPNTEVAKNDIRRMYSNIKEMDHQVGEIIQELKDAGELENTIIFWYTDHGGPLPRQKRLLYDSGLKVPMIVRYPKAQYAGQRDERLISFIDLAPTAMSIAGLNIPSYMNGQSFIGDGQKAARDYIYAAADRFDETTDTDRAVRDHRYKYIKHYKPELPMFLHVAYRDQMPIMRELYRLRDAGELTTEQALWFAETKPEEELYDTQTDPHEVNNIADDPNYQDKLIELREACAEWIESTNDRNIIPEEELLQQILPDGIQPVTADPTYSISDGQVTLTSNTAGASIGYKYVETDSLPGMNNWSVYDGPFTISSDKELVTIAHRIGYKPSEIVSVER